MTTLKQAIKTIRENIHADQIVVRGKLVTFRRGFFYKSGGTAEIYAEKIISELGAAKVDAVLVSSGEVWKAFRGSATVANSSHWHATVELKNVEG